jgi:CubicO group peptidase (beta-lactamase class C family)
VRPARWGPGRRALLGIGLVGSMATSATAQSARPVERLSSYIEESRRAWNVAGLVVAVVQGDSVVYARGFGRRDVRRPDPVDTNTVFPIGSITKFFTATAAGLMVDAGKMAWDRPLAEYLPGFSTADPWVSAKLTLRDALTHRSGLDWRLDFLWLQSPLTTNQILERVRDFVPDPGFRERYGYSNIMFAAAGMAVAEVSGQPWDEFVRQRLLGPLGMRSSGTAFRDSTRGRNVAVPHTNYEGAPVPVANPWDPTNTAPAGAIHSTASDMIRWLRFVLGRGELEGKRLIAESTFQEIVSPQLVVGLPERILRPVVNFELYGLGVELLDYRGRTLIKHGGKVDGIRTEFAVLPDARLGIVILSNTTGFAGLREVADPVLYRVLDHYLGAPETDWNTKFLESRQAALSGRQKGADRAAASRVSGTRPTLPIAAYAGTYAGPLGNGPAGTERARRIGPFGKVTVDSGRLRLRFGPFDAPLEHWHYDTFRFYWPVLGGWLNATFTFGPAGQVDRLRLDAVGELVRTASDSSSAATR